MSCPECPACQLVKWLEEQIDNLTEEEFIKGFKFNIPRNVWKYNDFNVKRIHTALQTMKYRVRDVAISYKRVCKRYIIELEFSGV